MSRACAETSPKIFGPNENEGLDIDASRALFQELIHEINKTKETKLTMEEVAAGFLRVANEAMCRPIRTQVAQSLQVLPTI
jgi:5-oxoprolinase (ATP-hydrolysing)